MRDFLKEKPWYFALIAFGKIGSPIVEWIVIKLFDEDKATEFLQRTIFISDVIPWVTAIVILLICIIIYIVQLNNSKKNIVSSDDLNSINSVLSKIVEENEYVESMQAFQYTVKNGQNEKYIKLNYLAGSANERIEINTILQTYFYFSYSLYKKITKVSGYYETYCKESDPVKKDSLQTTFKNEGNSLCLEILALLEKINCEDEITEHHCDMYRVLAKVLPTISGNAIESFLNNKDIELSLIKHKKTGILGAIVINDLYIFKNQNSISKNNRIYFAFPYNKEKKITFLGSINGLCFPSNSIDSVESYCKDVVNNVFSN